MCFRVPIDVLQHYWQARIDLRVMMSAAEQTGGDTALDYYSFEYSWTTWMDPPLLLEPLAKLQPWSPQDKLWTFVISPNRPGIIRVNILICAESRSHAFISLSEKVDHLYRKVLFVVEDESASMTAALLRNWNLLVCVLRKALLLCFFFFFTVAILTWNSSYWCYQSHELRLCAGIEVCVYLLFPFKMATV